GSGLHAVALVAVEVLVEVGGDDVLFALLAGVGLGQPERLDDLPDLPLLAAAAERRLREQSGADELLGDRRAAARMALERVEGRRHEAAEVEAGVRPEVLVLDRRRRVEQLGRDLLEGDELALELAEPGQLDLAAAIGDPSLLVELEVGERVLGVGQALAVVVVGRSDRDETRQADQDEDRQDQEGDRDDDSSEVRRATRPSALDAAPMALTPREAGLHVGPHDSIGVVVDPLVRTVETARPAAL